MIKPPTGPFVTLHQQTHRWARDCGAFSNQVPVHPNLLYGRRLRKISQPALVFSSVQKIGPTRHALAQRTVAGLLEIHEPWANLQAVGGKDNQRTIRQAKGVQNPAPRQPLGRPTDNLDAD